MGHSTYRSVFAEKVIEFGKQGLSLEQIASRIEVAPGTIVAWAKQYGEFAEALEMARIHSQAWWEDIGQRMMVESPNGDKLNASLWSKSISARFPRTYRENKIDINHSGAMALSHEDRVIEMEKRVAERLGINHQAEVISKNE